MPKIEPLNDRILVRRRDSQTDRTKGGLFIPDNAKEKPTEGIVVAVGPGTLRDDGTRNVLTLREGDAVLFGKYAGTEIQVASANQGEAFLLMREDEVFARIVDDPLTQVPTGTSSGGALRGVTVR